MGAGAGAVLCHAELAPGDAMPAHFHSVVVTRVLLSRVCHHPRPGVRWHVTREVERGKTERQQLEALHRL